MNKHLFTGLLLATAVFAFSCKKSDAVADTVAEQNTATIQWRTVTNWTSTQENGKSNYQAALNDSSITEDVLRRGLVLVFAKNNDKAEALPFEQSSVNGNTEWNYQTSEGSILIFGSTNGTFNKSQFITYRIFNAAQLEALNDLGVTKEQLLQMSFDQLSAIK